MHLVSSYFLNTNTSKSFSIYYNLWLLFFVLVAHSYVFLIALHDKLSVYISSIFLPSAAFISLMILHWCPCLTLWISFSFVVFCQYLLAVVIITTFPILWTSSSACLAAIVIWCLWLCSVTTYNQLCLSTHFDIIGNGIDHSDPYLPASNTMFSIHILIIFLKQVSLKSYSNINYALWVPM